MVALRASRAYRTVSHAAATVLAGLPPLELTARQHANVYEGVRRLRASNPEVTKIPDRIRRALKAQEKTVLLDAWKDYLSNPALPGRRTVDAVQPNLDEWLECRRRRGLTYHAVQVLTGHGCFGSYLHRREGSHYQVPPLQRRKGHG
ncbi:uncharacterized protein [Temnothorax longispinosus]|uniref:uncharacterized protein n=1 Tax=Temnothorax longispinosus TaxID=300112 RepID=UPI003A98D9FC